MRILEIETFGRGGLIHYAYNLSRALAGRGHEVTLLTASGYELEGREVPPNLRLVKLVARFSHRVRRTLPPSILRWAVKFEVVGDALAVAAMARRLRPDVIHFHSTNTSALAYLTLLRGLRVPVAVTAHVVTPHEPIRFQEAVYRRLRRLSDLTIAHSDFDRRRLVGEFAAAPEAVVVIPHGEYGFFDHGVEPLDRRAARRDLGLEPEEEVALFFGYIREYKGLDILLGAWPEVKEARPRARLVVAGDAGRLKPERRNELESWATRVGALHRFDYIPFSDVARYFAAADVVVMPYRHISQSGVLYLALSLGVPVVASRVGGLSEVLSDDESALLVPPESPSELAEAIVRVLGDPDLGKRLSAAGRRVTDRHSWPRIAEQTESEFARLVSG
jgi:glycosyltransferase involved in cell wall biosynthesis